MLSDTDLCANEKSFLYHSCIIAVSRSGVIINHTELSLYTKNTSAFVHITSIGFRAMTQPIYHGGTGTQSSPAGSLYHREPSPRAPGMRSINMPPVCKENWP